MAGTVFSRLAPLIIYNFALQATAAAVCVPLKTEKYYDLLGATGFLSGALLSLHYPWMRARLWEGRNVAFPALSSHAPRQLLLTGALAIWSARLGYFLFDVSLHRLAQYPQNAYQVSLVILRLACHENGQR